MARNSFDGQGLVTTTAFRHNDLGVYVAEASDIGLLPGQWPTSMIAVVDGHDIVLTRSFIVREQEGDVMWVEYKHLADSPIKALFKIYND